MEADFWHKKWERNEIDFHVDGANPLLVNSFHKLALSKGARIFLPLCGKTLDIAWLASQGYRVAGIEINESAVKQLFGEMGVDPNISRIDKFTRYGTENIDIYVGDFFDLSRDILRPVNATYDRAALVALPEDMRKRYARLLMAITDRAPQLLITYEYDQSKMDGPPFSVTHDEVIRSYQDTYVVTLLESIGVPGGFKGICPARENVWLLR